MFHQRDHKLTSGDIKVLRNADTICLDYREGEGYIRAIRRKEHTKDGFEQVVKVPTNTETRSCGECGEGDPSSCYEMIHYPKTDLYWQTIVGCLKIGDILTLKWSEVGRDSQCYIGTATCQTSATLQKVVPLYWDWVDLMVKRDGRKGLAFKVSNSHTPDNSAKMIRRK